MISITLWTNKIRQLLTLKELNQIKIYILNHRQKLKNKKSL